MISFNERKIFTEIRLRTSSFDFHSIVHLENVLNHQGLENDTVSFDIESNVALATGQRVMPCTPFYPTLLHPPPLPHKMT